VTATDHRRRALRASAAVAIVALCLLHPLAGGAPAGAQDDRTSTPGRLLVFAVPGITWDDLRGRELPAFEALLEDAAMADLAPRGVSARSGPGDAYLTISGGSRATTVRGIDGQVLALDETSSGSDAGEIFRRRTGEEPDGPFVSLTWPSLVRANDAEPFDTRLGALTEALEDGSIGAAAIGNADGLDSIGDSYERQAGLALADARGVVPGGSLAKDLLTDDVTQPFGKRLDPDVTAEAFREAWSASAPSEVTDGGVVLVEASDLARTLRYRSIVDDARYQDMWTEALEHSDELLGRLLESVDLDRDAVLLVAPYNGRGDRDLTAVALRTPATSGGYLRSASTQRPGFLTLVDIGPTILANFDLPRPVEMEGRPAVVEPSSDDLDERLDHLITLNEASRFREQLLTPTTTLVVLACAVVLALAIGAHANGWSRRARQGISAVGLGALTVLPASYLARVFPLEELGIGFYWSFVLALAVAVPGALLVALRHRPGSRRPLMAVLGLVALVLVGDVMTGSNLSLSAAFGYSATGNSRLYGISNYSYGQLAASTTLLAAWVALVVGDRRGRLAGLGLMLATLVVLGVPIWGSDVGGVLAYTPAIAAYWLVITKRRIRVRSVLIGGLATALAIGVFGLLDLARAPDSRSHLGRLFERVGEEGPGPLLSLVQRKLLANLEVSTSSMWVLAIPLALVFWTFLRRYPDRPYDRLVARFPTLPAGLAALLVAGLLGSALNDSGAIIGGIVATIAATSLAILLLGLDPAPTPVRGDGPSQR
jgi:hypothetical protein